MHTAESLRRELPKITNFGACFSRGVPANIAANGQYLVKYTPELLVGSPMCTAFNRGSVQTDGTPKLSRSSMTRQSSTCDSYARYMKSK